MLRILQRIVMILVFIALQYKGHTISNHRNKNKLVILTRATKEKHDTMEAWRFDVQGR